MTIPVLICDDSSLARKQIAKTLPKNWDISITYATNGAEGLDAIRAGLGEIVFLDLNMPVLDGYDVLKTVQAEDLPALIIVVSGDIQAKALDRVKAYGALDFIKKPINEDTITNVLNDYGILALAQTERKQEKSEFIEVNLLDACQEMSNLAMSGAALLLSKVLDAFIQLPTPIIQIAPLSELITKLEINNSDSISALCQGFISPSISGEAILFFNDDGFDDLAKLFGIGEQNSKIEREIDIMIEVGNILIGAFLTGIAEQLTAKFSQGHPVILGQNTTVMDMFSDKKEQKVLSIELNHRIEGYNIKCDLLLLITEDSLFGLEQKLNYLLG